MKYTVRRSHGLAFLGTGILLTALVGGSLPSARGQTAGPVATQTRTIVAGPQNGGVAVIASGSQSDPFPGLGGSALAPAGTGSTNPSSGATSGATTAGGSQSQSQTVPGTVDPGVAGAARPAGSAATPAASGRPLPSGVGSSSAAGAVEPLPAPVNPANVLGGGNQIISIAAPSTTGQGNANIAPAVGNLNLTPAAGVSLIAGQSLLYVPPGSASCAATAQLGYSRDQAAFAATCGNGSTLNLSQPATLCLQPSPQVLTQAKGNVANLSVTAAKPLKSFVSPSGILVCAQVITPDSYMLSVSGQVLPQAPLHTPARGAKVSLPAVGLGGLASELP